MRRWKAVSGLTVLHEGVVPGGRAVREDSGKDRNKKARFVSKDVTRRERQRAPLLFVLDRIAGRHPPPPAPPRASESIPAPQGCSPRSPWCGTRCKPATHLSMQDRIVYVMKFSSSGAAVAMSAAA
eukprot:SAG22_NODE_155_length_17123_cov_37.528489_10_plen_126_part_00